MSKPDFAADADELERRRRSLVAERLRPEKQVTTADLLGDLVQALAQLYRTPPDAPRPVDNSVDRHCEDSRDTA